MGAWSPRGKTPAKNPHVDIIVEPWEGGRWFERDGEGRESLWGKVLAWDPPRRMLLGWQLDPQFRYDPALLTEAELRFSELAGGGTRVTLQHRQLERFGAEAGAFADKLRSGWPGMIGCFERYAADHP